MAWIQYAWICRHCSHKNESFAGSYPEGISSGCRVCKQRVHLDLTPRIEVIYLDEKENESG